MSFDTSKKNSSKYGKGGIAGGNTKYDQMKINKKFIIHKESGLNKHKPNVTTDKPFDSHIGK